MLLRIKLLFGLALLLGIASLLIACGGITQTDYDAAKQALAAQDQKNASLQSQLSAKEKEIADLKSKAAAPAAPVAQPTAAKQAGINWTAKPTFTPRPPPTPLPAGVTPPPPAQMPASYNDAVKFVYYVETLTSGAHPSIYGLEPTVACVLSGVFKRGTKIVWRFEIIDTSTGKRLTAQDAPTIKIKIPGKADDLTGRFSQRAGGAGMPDAPWMWAAGWDIPPDYPLGALDYSIVVTTKDGRTDTWKIPALIQKIANGIDSRVLVVD